MRCVIERDNSLLFGPANELVNQLGSSPSSRKLFTELNLLPVAKTVVASNEATYGRECCAITSVVGTKGSNFDPV